MVTAEETYDAWLDANTKRLENGRWCKPLNIGIYGEPRCPEHIEEILVWLDAKMEGREMPLPSWIEQLSFGIVVGERRVAPRPIQIIPNIAELARQARAAAEQARSEDEHWEHMGELSWLHEVGRASGLCPRCWRPMSFGREPKTLECRPCGFSFS